MPGENQFFDFQKYNGETMTAYEFQSQRSQFLQEIGFEEFFQDFYKNLALTKVKDGTGNIVSWLNMDTVGLSSAGANNQKGSWQKLKVDQKMKMQVVKEYLEQEAAASYYRKYLNAVNMVIDAGKGSKSKSEDAEIKSIEDVFNDNKAWNADGSYLAGKSVDGKTNLATGDAIDSGNEIAINDDSFGAKGEKGSYLKFFYKVFKALNEAEKKTETLINKINEDYDPFKKTPAGAPPNPDFTDPNKTASLMKDIISKYNSYVKQVIDTLESKEAGEKTTSMESIIRTWAKTRGFRDKFSSIPEQQRKIPSPATTSSKYSAEIMKFMDKFERGSRMGNLVKGEVLAAHVGAFGTTTSLEIFSSHTMGLTNEQDMVEHPFKKNLAVLKNNIIDLMSGYDYVLHGSKSKLAYLQNFNLIGSGSIDNRRRDLATTNASYMRYLTMNKSFTNPWDTQYEQKVGILNNFFNVMLNNMLPEYSDEVKVAMKDDKKGGKQTGDWYVDNRKTLYSSLNNAIDDISGSGDGKSKYKNVSVGSPAGSQVYDKKAKKYITVNTSEYFEDYMQEHFDKVKRFDDQYYDDRSSQSASNSGGVNLGGEINDIDSSNPLMTGGNIDDNDPALANKAEKHGLTLKTMKDNWGSGAKKATLNLWRILREKDEKGKNGGHKLGFFNKMFDDLVALGYTKDDYIKLMKSEDSYKQNPAGFGNVFVQLRSTGSEGNNNQGGDSFRFEIDFTRNAKFGYKSYPKTTADISSKINFSDNSAIFRHPLNSKVKSIDVSTSGNKFVIDIEVDVVERRKKFSNISMHLGSLCSFALVINNSECLNNRTRIAGLYLEECNMSSDSSSSKSGITTIKLKLSSLSSLYYNGSVYGCYTSDARYYAYRDEEKSETFLQDIINSPASKGTPVFAFGGVYPSGEKGDNKGASNGVEIYSDMKSRFDNILEMAKKWSIGSRDGNGDSESFMRTQSTAAKNRAIQPHFFAGHDYQQSVDVASYDDDEGHPTVAQGETMEAYCEEINAFRRLTTLSKGHSVGDFIDMFNRRFRSYLRPAFYINEPVDIYDPSKDKSAQKAKSKKDEYADNKNEALIKTFFVKIADCYLLPYVAPPRSVEYTDAEQNFANAIYSNAVSSSMTFQPNMIFTPSFACGVIAGMPDASALDIKHPIAPYLATEIGDFSSPYEAIYTTKLMQQMTLAQFGSDKDFPDDDKKVNLAIGSYIDHVRDDLYVKGRSNDVYMVYGKKSSSRASESSGEQYDKDEMDRAYDLTNKVIDFLSNNYVYKHFNGNLYGVKFNFNKFSYKNTSSDNIFFRSTQVNNSSYGGDLEAGAIGGLKGMHLTFGIAKENSYETEEGQRVNKMFRKLPNSLKTFFPVNERTNTKGTDPSTNGDSRLERDVFYTSTSNVQVQGLFSHSAAFTATFSFAGANYSTLSLNDKYW